MPMIERAQAALRRAFRIKAPPLRGVDAGGWWNLGLDVHTGAWQQNIKIDQGSVMANWSVFACMTLIAGDIGKMEVCLLSRGADGVWDDYESPAFGPVLRKPNSYQIRQKFFESWVFSKLAHGNAYILKERDARGVVTGMHVLDPNRVRPLVSPSGMVFYELQDDDLSGVPRGLPAVPASEIIHDRMWCLHHPLVGVSPIYACGLAATQGVAIQGNSAKFFENMSRPSGVLTAPGKISDETARRLKDAWEDNYGGNKIGRLAVLGDDLKYQAMTISASDAQLVEQLKMTAEMVCTAFHVPGYKVGVGPMPTYQNAEVLNGIYYADCLQTLIESIEALLDDGLGLGRVGSNMLGVEFDLDGLLRMDTATQIKTLNEAVGGGWMAPNEARMKRNMPPVPGGASPYLQQQNYSLAALDKRDRGEPFAQPTTAPMDQTNQALALLLSKAPEDLLYA